MAEQPAAAAAAPQSPPSSPAGQPSPPAQRQSAPPPAQRIPEPTNAQYHAWSPDQRRTYDDQRNADRDAPRRADTPQAGDDRLPGDQPPPEPTQTTLQTVKIGELSLTEQDVRGLMERSALEQSRKLTIPPTPNDYKLELPKDFVAPQGTEFRWATADPVIAPLIEQAKVFAHEAGLDQTQFSKMMSFYAATEITKMTRFNEILQKEISKLGPSGTPRITAIQTFLRAQLGDDLAKPLSAMIVSEPIVRGWERIMAGFRGQSGHNYSNANREPPEPQGRVSEEQWGRMSAGEKLDYSRGFNQDQFQRGNGRR